MWIYPRHIYHFWRCCVLLFQSVCQWLEVCLGGLPTHTSDGAVCIVVSVCVSVAWGVSRRSADSDIRRCRHCNTFATRWVSQSRHIVSGHCLCYLSLCVTAVCCTQSTDDYVQRFELQLWVCIYIEIEGRKDVRILASLVRQAAEQQTNDGSMINSGNFQRVLIWLRLQRQYVDGPETVQD